MRKLTYILLFLALPVTAFSQLNDAGGMLSVAATKDLWGNLSVDFGEELRFNKQFSAFNRSTTSVSASHPIIRKLLKAEIGYELLCYNEENRYDLRHRFLASLNAERSYLRYDFKFRTRLQSTLRDETHGDYKFNPKYVWRNKIEMQYSFFSLPLKPYFSGELFCALNSKNGFFANQYRVTAGAKYRLSYRHTLDFFLRYDQEIQVAAPQNILYVGGGWKYKF